MKRLLSSATLSMFVAIILAQAAYAQCGSCGRNGSDIMCGPKSLFMVCEKLGVKADLEELARLSGKNEQGTTLLGLYKAVQKKKLHAVGMKIGLDDLARIKVPAIAHLWGNHFVVVENTADGLRVTDPSKKVDDPAKEDQTIPLDAFKARYSGFALLISRDEELFPDAATGGPDIRFGAYNYDLGFADEGAIIDRTITFRNAGNMHLAIYKVRSSCGCMIAATVDKVVAPGGQGEINLVFDTMGLSGGQAKELYVQSNDPVSPLVRLEVGVVVKPNRVLVSARSINLGEISIHGGAEKEIYVRDPGDGSLVIEKVESDSPSLVAALAGSIDRERPGYIVPLTLKPGLPVGEFKSKITIHTNHPKEPRVEIPVTAAIKGDVEIFPQTFFLGLLKEGETAKKSVTVSTIGKDPLHIEKIDTPFDFISVEIDPSVEGKEYVLTATLNGTAPTGNIKGDIVIHTNNHDQPEIRVPVYALVEDKNS